MKIKNRKTGEIITKKESSTVTFLYKNALGRFFLKILIRPFISKIVGTYMNSRLSTRRIDKFIKTNNIDMGDYVYEKYKSYNAFFTRKIKTIKRPIDYNKTHLISPCDAKLSVYKITSDSTFLIKNSHYSVRDLIENDIAYEYENGYCLIFRLEVDDYHRYCYIDNGHKDKNIHIKGVLHTVQPISLERYNIYHRNSREYTVLHTKNFDDVIQVEVGALCVGKIKNHHQNHNFKKGEEKGFFEFGGSTVVLLIKKDIVKIDSDLLKNTEDGLETIVKYGEKIGHKQALFHNFIRRIFQKNSSK